MRPARGLAHINAPKVTKKLQVVNLVFSLIPAIQINHISALPQLLYAFNSSTC